MADKKISALTAATTPLAGTEVLPIVQSGATVKVANNDLRPKQIQSNATSGVLQIAGPAAAATRVMTVPDANFTAARTDAANSFTGDQTLSTGNLIQGTAAKGVNFTANTPASGMTSQLLNWYEEGTFTPVVAGTGSAGTATYASQSGRYTRIGRMVHFSLYVSYSGHTGTGSCVVQGLPFASAGTQFACSIADLDGFALSANNIMMAAINAGAQQISLQQTPVGGGTIASAIIDAAAGFAITGSYSV